MSTKFDEEQIELVRNLARFLTQEQIANVLGMSHSTLKNRMSDQPEILEAFHQGKASMIADVAHKAYSMAMDGHFGAIKLILKSQGGWSEKSEVQVTTTSGPQVMVYLPGNDRQDVQVIESRPLEVKKLEQ